MKTLVVETNIATRLDRYLKRFFSNITQGLIEKLIRLHKIKVNKIKCKANTRVKLGDIIDIYSQDDIFIIDEDEEMDSIEFPKNIVKLGNDIMNNYKIAEFDNFIAINKPHNLSTQGGPGISRSIDHGLQYLNTTSKTQLKIIHRLDYATSGILLIGKGYEGTETVNQIIRNNQIEKIYLAMLINIPQNDTGIITSYIRKTIHNNKFIVTESDMNDKLSKLAITDYQVIAKNTELNRSLCIFKLKTGRMHQIRHHANLLKTCVVGDNLYNLDNNIVNEGKKLMLHALAIGIPNISDKEIFLEALPSKTFINKIKETFNIKSIDFTILQHSKQIII